MEAAAGRDEGKKNERAVRPGRRMVAVGKRVAARWIVEMALVRRYGPPRHARAQGARAA